MRLSPLSFLLVAFLAACGDGTEDQAAAPAVAPEVQAAAEAPAPEPTATIEPTPATPAPPEPAPVTPAPEAVPPLAAPEATPNPAGEVAPAVTAEPAPAALPAETPTAPEPAVPTPAEAAAAPAEGTGVLVIAGNAEAGRSYAARCAACHSFEDGGEARVGPTLFGVFGNRVGADLNFPYSEAFQRLRDEGAIWDAARLEAFLADPPAAIPGTAMTVPMVRDAEDRVDLIAWLATLVPAEAAPEPGAPGGDLLARIAAADPAEGEQQARRCSVCHTFNAGGQALIGPNLYGIIGATVGRSAGFAYSFALRERRDQGAIWTYDLLDAFIRSPQEAIPGTAMGFTGMADDGDRAALIAWVRTQADEPFPIPARVGVVVAGLAPVAFLRQQASNGEAGYAACDGCHGTHLEGVAGMGPPLTGTTFADHWFGGNAYELFEYVRRNMPPDNRRGLTDFQYINIVAYILRENGFVANFEAEQYLPVGADELRGIGLFQY